MSMQQCAACARIKDSDVVQFDTIHGEDVCESCWPPEDESMVPHPRTALFRLAAALAVAEFVQHDTRPADAIAPALYYPAECEVCGLPPMQGSLYCSETHRQIVEGEPTMQDLALNQ